MSSPGVATGYAVVGAILLAVELILVAPGNGLLDLRRHRIPGTVLSHSALVLIAISLAPVLPGLVARLAFMRAATVMAWIAASLAAPVAVMLVVATLAPRYAREVFTREWGLVEPTQFVLYLGAARLCTLVRPRSPWAVWARRGGLMTAVWLALEEIDYLGALEHVVPRVDGRRIGGLHDLLNLFEGRALLALLAVPLLLGVGVAAFILARLGSRGLRRIALSPITASLAAAAGFMIIAQAVDISDSHVAAIAFGRPVGVIEEPAELLAIVCLNWALALSVARSVRAVSPRGERRVWLPERYLGGERPGGRDDEKGRPAP